jgi:cell wall assembly regulator SMI1
VDLAPGPKGKFGLIIILGCDFDYRCVVADSWTEFFDAHVSYLENGDDLEEDKNGMPLCRDGRSRIE